MDIHAIRLENLRRLMRDLFDNKQATLAGAAGIAPGYVSFLFTGRKRLGEALAREIERRLDLAPYSLDQESGPAVAVQEHKEAYRVSRRRTRRLIARLSEAEAKDYLDEADIAALEAVLARLINKARAEACLRRAGV
ncbi:MAG: hypothetical protein KGJ55_06985 [Gammaproteobacteria bacterium]|nr:hypothetical protein [Gammaproteobacteria bacterium]